MGHRAKHWNYPRITHELLAVTRLLWVTQSYAELHSYWALFETLTHIPAGQSLGSCSLVRLVHILPVSGKLNCSYKLLEKGRNCSINCPLRAQYFSLEWPNLTTVRTLAPRKLLFSERMAGSATGCGNCARTKTSQNGRNCFFGQKSWKLPQKLPANCGQAYARSNFLLDRFLLQKKSQNKF